MLDIDKCNLLRSMRIFSYSLSVRATFLLLWQGCWDYLLVLFGRHLDGSKHRWHWAVVAWECLLCQVSMYHLPNCVEAVTAEQTISPTNRHFACMYFWNETLSKWHACFPNFSSICNDHLEHTTLFWPASGLWWPVVSNWIIYKPDRFATSAFGPIHFFVCAWHGPNGIDCWQNVHFGPI